MVQFKPEAALAALLFAALWSFPHPATAQGAPPTSAAAAAGSAQPASPQPSDKDKAAQLLEQARPLATAKSWAAVRPLAEEAARLTPESAAAQELLGLSLHAAKKFPQALLALEKAAQLGADSKVFARAAAECAERKKDRPRTARWFLAVAKEERDQAAALKSARAADAPAARVEAYELAQSLGKVGAADLEPFAAASEALGKLAGAAALYDQAAEANPKELKLALAAARLKLAIKDVASAESRSAKLASTWPDDPGVLFLAAQIAQAKGDAEGEKRLLAALIEKHPRFAPGQLRLGRLALAADDLPAARKAFSAAVAAAPNDAEARRLSSGAALRAGDKSAALAEGKAAQRLAPKDAEANLTLGRAAFANEDWRLAAGSLQAGRAAAGAEALVELGDVLLRTQQGVKAKAALGDALTKDAGNARAHELLGDLALAEKRPKEAVQHFAAALQRLPKDVPLLVKQAQAADAAGDPAAAAAALDSILTEKPTDPAAAVARARLFRAGKQPERAAALLAPVAAANPKSAPVASALAVAALEQGDAAAAQKAAEGALAIDAGDPGAHDVLGRLLFTQGKRAEARSHLEAACGLGAQLGKKGVVAGAVGGAEASGDALLALGELELAAGKKDAAKALLARARAAGARRAPVLQARAQAREGDLAGAERTLGSYLAQSGDDGDALSAAADVAYDRGNYPLARERFEKAVSRLPAGALTPLAQGRLCDVRVRGGAYAEAKAACEGAIKGGNDVAGVHAAYGLALYRGGDKKAGKDELDAAVKKGAKDAPVHAALGAIAFEEGRDGDALAHYGQVLAQERSSVEANAATGRILARRRQHKEAAARLGRAFAGQPDDPQLGADLAKAQLSAGNLAGAQKTLAAIPTNALPTATYRALRGRVENALGNYRRANDEYEKALKEAPGDPELLALSGENFLKLPNYDRAIAQLEKAKAADPQRLDVSRQLTRLYAETGESAKAATELQAVESLEKQQTLARRRELDPKDLRRLSFAGDLKPVKGTEANAALAKALSNAVVSDLSRSAYVIVSDQRDAAAVAAERDRLAGQANLSDAELAKLTAGEKVPDFVVAGEYALDGEEITVDLKAQSPATRTSKASHQSGPRGQYAVLQKAAVVDLLQKMGVPLSADEQAALARTEGTPNLESFLLTQQARDAEKTDVRQAADLYKRARDADQGNASALLGLERSLVEAQKKNQLAVPEPTVLGAVPEALPTMVRRTLQSKLSGVKGIKVIEQEIDPVLGAELDRLANEAEAGNLDKKDFDAAKLGQTLAANVLVRAEITQSGNELGINARLQDITNAKILYGTRRSGSAKDQQLLQNQVAKDLVQFLRGEPSDEEKAALESTLKEEEYQRQMGELAELRAKERARKEAEAKARSEGVAVAKVEPPKIDEAKPPEFDPTVDPVIEPPPAPEAKKLGPIDLPQTADRTTWNVFSGNLRLSSMEPRADGEGQGSVSSLGVVFSHQSQRTGNLRTALLVDLESTRKLGGRTEARSGAGFYGLGYDVTIPIAIKGVGLTVGAESVLGLAQSQLQGGPVESGLALTLAPHLGLALAWHGVGITGDLGYRFPIGLTNSIGDKVGLRGFFVQAGLRTETLQSDAHLGGLALGYTAHILVPNDPAAVRYKSTGLAGGALLEHTFTLASRSGRSSVGAVFSYGSQSASEVDKLVRGELGLAMSWSAFQGEELFNPYLGFRLSLLYGKQGTEDTDGKLGLLIAPTTGLELQLFRWLALDVGVSYDAVGGDLSIFSGYALDLGATVRF